MTTRPTFVVKTLKHWRDCYVNERLYKLNDTSSTVVAIIHARKWLTNNNSLSSAIFLHIFSLAIRKTSRDAVQRHAVPCVVLRCVALRYGAGSGVNAAFSLIKRGRRILVWQPRNTAESAVTRRLFYTTSLIQPDFINDFASCLCWVQLNVNLFT